MAHRHWPADGSTLTLAPLLPEQLAGLRTERDARGTARAQARGHRRLRTPQKRSESRNGGGQKGSGRERLSLGWLERAARGCGQREGERRGADWNARVRRAPYTSRKRRPTVGS